MCQKLWKKAFYQFFEAQVDGLKSLFFRQINGLNSKIISFISHKTNVKLLSILAVEKCWSIKIFDY